MRCCRHDKDHASDIPLAKSFIYQYGSASLKPDLLSHSIGSLYAQSSIPAWRKRFTQRMTTGACDFHHGFGLRLIVFTIGSFMASKFACNLNILYNHRQCGWAVLASPPLQTDEQIAEPDRELPR